MVPSNSQHFCCNIVLKDPIFICKFDNGKKCILICNGSVMF